MRILVLGDTHFPFHHKGALLWACSLRDVLKPTHVVQVGDLKDMFSFSKYPKVFKMSPEKELALARTAAQKMWASFKGLSCYQLMGNHDDRPLKKAIACVPELAFMVGSTLRDLYTFTGVTTVHDSRQELVLGGITFQHGHRSRLGDHVRYNQTSTVVGHSHTGGVAFVKTHNKTLWELNAGFLGDINSPAFGYHAQKRAHTTTLGVGFIDSYGPRFIPYMVK